jgi:hypothetical protein
MYTPEYMLELQEFVGWLPTKAILVALTYLGLLAELPAPDESTILFDAPMVCPDAAFSSCRSLSYDRTIFVPSGENDGSEGWGDVDPLTTVTTPVPSEFAIFTAQFGPLDSFHTTLLPSAEKFGVPPAVNPTVTAVPESVEALSVVVMFEGLYDV